MQTSYQQTSSRILTRDCVTVGIVFIQVQTVRIGFLGLLLVCGVSVDVFQVKRVIYENNTIENKLTGSFCFYKEPEPGVKCFIVEKI